MLSLGIGPFRFGKLVCLLALVCLPGLAQQSVPDAPQPKPSSQPSQFPEGAPPAPKNDHAAPPDAASTPTPAAPAPGNEILATDLAKFGGIIVPVNAVQIPVTVRDNTGRMVTGLTPADFTVLEDGVAQRLRFFSSDAFPLSTAVVLETDLPAATMKKVNNTLPALVGAFTEFDEVAIYRYGHTVSQMTGFSGAASISTATLAKVKRPGSQGGPPQVFGPIAQGPTINGHPVYDPNAQTATGTGASLQTAKESYVLNDAILRAAQDLAHRDRTRRKVIFVISDGRELGSQASYNEVLRVLLSNNIAVYALGVDTAALPIYDKLNRFRLPGFGYGNILPLYASNTGGQNFAQFDQQSIEQAYSKITDAARNQYTLVYYAKATASSGYRVIDVRVHRPNLVVTAKAGYYPLPQQPSLQQAVPQPTPQR
jgi:VWFA-related protein